MKLEHKYAISMALFTLWALVLYVSKDTLIICAANAILALSNLLLMEHNSILFPHHSPKEFLKNLTILLAFILFFVLIFQIPKKELSELFGKWYFMGTLWVLY